MSYKSRSNYAISQKVSESDWQKWFPKESIKETLICIQCKQSFDIESALEPFNMICNTCLGESSERI